MDVRRTETCVTPTCIAPRHVDALRDFLFLFSPNEQRGGRGGDCQTFFFFSFPVQQTTSGIVVVVVVVVVFTLKTVLTSIQYPSLSYSSRQRNEFPWSHANPK